MSSKAALSSEPKKFTKDALKTISPTSFAKKKLLQKIGWSEEQHAERQSHLKDYLMSRRSSSRNIGLFDLYNWLQDYVSPWESDKMWFHTKLSVHNLSPKEVERLRIDWYCKWARYIKYHSPWQEEQNQHDSRPKNFTESARLSSTVAEKELEHGASNVEESTFDDIDVENTRLSTTTRADDHQEAQSCKLPTKASADKSTYRWDSSYLHITSSPIDDFMAIPLGLLIPEGFTTNCSYLNFKHKDLLKQLQEFEMISPDETDFQLFYQGGERKFNLANRGGYLCALGHFSRQPRAFQQALEPMFVTLKRSGDDHHGNISHCAKRPRPNVEDSEWPESLPQRRKH